MMLESCCVGPLAIQSLTRRGARTQPPQHKILLQWCVLFALFYTSGVLVSPRLVCCYNLKSSKRLSRYLKNLNLSSPRSILNFSDLFLIQAFSGSSEEVSLPTERYSRT